MTVNVTQHIKVNNVITWSEGHGEELHDLIDGMRLVPVYPNLRLSWKLRKIWYHLVVSTTDMLSKQDMYDYIDEFHPENNEPLSKIAEQGVRWISQIVWRISEWESSEDMAIGAFTALFSEEGYLYRYMAGAFNVEAFDVFKDDEMKQIMGLDIYKVFAATNAFMHCKNVPIIDEPLSRQQRRHKDRQRKKGQNVTEFKILDLYPLKAAVAADKSEGSDMKKAMHFVRGHFATYTEDAPLFGKVTGTFWKPAHIRGDRNEGKVIKDYRIKL